MGGIRECEALRVSSTSSFEREEAQEARCLEDLLPCDTTINVMELLAAIGKGEGMLIVCDGFDELPREQRQEGSVYVDLLKGRLLPEATIIVTSRPSVSAELWSLCQHNIDRHLEVIGFTKKDIERYAESVFTGDILAGFLSYITSNPPIYGMMYIPLNAVFVALIYQDNYDTDTPYPTTMTQLFDTLTCGLIRRHLVSTHQVPSEYCMPPSLQRTEDIYKLPPLVAQQLLQLARAAYESLCKKRYVFTDLGEDFEHLGTMKKTTSVNNFTGPGCSYSFHHLTLQEYLTALYIAIVYPSGFELVEWLKEGSVVVRFLAGMYRHDDHHSHPVYQELVQQLATESLQLVHCAYECPSILDSVKVDYSERSRDIIYVDLHSGYDWYTTGYCISRFRERWGIGIDMHGMEKFDLLMKGLTTSRTPNGKIRFLSLEDISFGQMFTQLRMFCQLDSLALYLSIDHDEEIILQQLIAPGNGLKSLEYSTFSWFNGDHTHDYTSTLIPHLFKQSSLLKLSLDIGYDFEDPMLTKWDILPHENTNLLELTISTNLLCPLAALIVNITSLTYLKIATILLCSDVLVLTNIVQSHHTLKVLDIGEIYEYEYISSDSSSNSDIPTTMDPLLQLIEAAGNSQLKKLKLYETDYENLPLHIHEQYKHLLVRWP